MLASLPDRTHEDWRWSDLSRVPAALGHRPAGAAAADTRPWRVGDGPLWVMIDGRLVERPEGGEANERAGAPLTGGDVRAHGVRLALGAAHAAPGTIEILHFSTGGAAHIAHGYSLGPDAQASVVETYVSLGDTPAWVNLAVEVELGRGARLMRSVRRLEASATATETARVAVGEGASYTATALLAGAGGGRAEHQVTLGGVGAFASVDGVVLAGGEARWDVFNRLHHGAETTAARQTWRALAKDRASASLIGRIEVARGAQKTDAEQSIRGLLFDRTATINAKPELEIFADDVKAAHGCAIGALDSQALFYLAARGIAPGPARALLTEAFVGDAIGQAGDPAARAALGADARRWLEASL